MSNTPIILLVAVGLIGCTPSEREVSTQPPQYPTVEVYHTPTPPPAAGWVKTQIERWSKALLRPEKVHFVGAITAQIERSRNRYDTVSAATGVPWTVVASIHNMECSQSFRQNLANGDPLTAKTRHVPKGRIPNVDPPYPWEQAAIDALKFDKLDRKDWTGIGNELQNIETYNGLGYQHYHPSVASPYLWSWTNLYVRGKYVADGTWSDTAISDQCGVVPILKTLNAEEK